MKIFAGLLILALFGMAGCSSGNGINAPNNSITTSNAGTAQNIRAMSIVTLDGSHSTGANGKLITYQWSFESMPSGSRAVLSSSTVVNPTFTPDMEGTYALSLIVDDGTVKSTPSSVTITASKANSAPVANAGPTQNEIVGHIVTLDGSLSGDADNDLLTYKWTITTKPVGSFSSLSNSSVVNPSFKADVVGNYVFNLVTNDGTDDSAVSSVIIIINEVNSIPIANAGKNQNVVSGTVVTLDGSKSSDADGDLITYSWSFTSKPFGSNAALSDFTVVNPTFTPDVVGAYVLNLVVKDGKINSFSVPVTINATKVNSAPVASAGSLQNVLKGAVVTLDGSKSSDSDRDLITYKWSFTSLPAGSSATLSNSTIVNPQFTADAVGAYILKLIVNDGMVDSAASIVTINAAKPNSAPVADAGSLQNILKDAVVTLNGSGSSDADGDELTYMWSFTSIPTGSSATLSNASTVNPFFTGDAVGAYVLRLVVNDGKLDSAATTVTVNVSKLNAAPVANAGIAQSVTTGVAVTLDGCASSDTDSDMLTYSWCFTSKPNASSAVLVNPNSTNPSFTADISGEYVLNLLVNDGKVNSAVAVVTVTASAANTVPALKLQLNLDLTFEPTVLYNLGTYQVDQTTKSSIVFNQNAGNITDPVLYDRIQNNFNFDNLYRVTTQSGKIYYFRFGWGLFDVNSVLRYVQWANGNMPSETGIMKFDLVSQEIVQTGNIEISTVGDSITWSGEGEALRIKMAVSNTNLKFVGSRTDTYGYGHEGEGGNNSQKVIDRIPSIKPSDNYFVLIGTNDRISPEQTLSNIKKIAAGLLTKKINTTVYFLTLLPRNDIYDEKNKTINDLLRTWITTEKNTQIKLLDIEPDFRNIVNWQKLIPDNVHPSAAGYDQLARIILSNPGPWLNQL